MKGQQSDPGLAVPILPIRPSLAGPGTVQAWRFLYVMASVWVRNQLKFLWFSGFVTFQEEWQSPPFEIKTTLTFFEVHEMFMRFTGGAWGSWR